MYDYYTTHCSFDQRVENYRITQNAAGKITVDEEYYFDTLISFVEVSCTALELKDGETFTSCSNTSTTRKMPMVSVVA